MQNSPHKLDSVEILVDYMKKHSARPDSTIDAQVAEILVPLHDDPAVASQVSWNTYFAPQGLKSALMSIGEELDPEHLERVRNSRKVMFGDESTSARGVPLVLFSGPPGTGKTHAMRLIAAKSGLTAYKLDATKLSKDSYQAPHLWSRVLEQISQYPRAGVDSTHMEATDALMDSTASCSSARQLPPRQPASDAVCGINSAPRREGLRHLRKRAAVVAPDASQ